jgi:hypothetical protein
MHGINRNHIEDTNEIFWRKETLSVTLLETSLMMTPTQ